MSTPPSSLWRSHLLSVRACLPWETLPSIFSLLRIISVSFLEEPRTLKVLVVAFSKIAFETDILKALIPEHKTILSLRTKRLRFLPKRPRRGISLFFLSNKPLQKQEQGTSDYAHNPSCPNSMGFLIRPLWLITENLAKLHVVSAHFFNVKMVLMSALKGIVIGKWK